jgi:hypothetical protein
MFIANVNLLLIKLTSDRYYDHRLFVLMKCMTVKTILHLSYRQTCNDTRYAFQNIIIIIIIIIIIYIYMIFCFDYTQNSEYLVNSIVPTYK